MLAKTSAVLVAVALVAGSFGSVQSAAAQSPGPGCASAPVAKKALRGFGRLVAAAHRAGVTDMLASNAGGILGYGEGGQLAGAVAGAAVAAADAAAAKTVMMGAGSAVSEGARAAQVASAVTGVAREFDAGAAGQPSAEAGRGCAPAPAPEQTETYVERR
jgi:hypothetical protein